MRRKHSRVITYPSMLDSFSMAKELKRVTDDQMMERASITFHTLYYKPKAQAN